MKPVLVSVFLLNLVVVFSLVPFKVREVLQTSIYQLVTHRIYGGSEAADGQFPFMVLSLIKVKHKLSQCSASLIRPDWVLLAAHCVCYPDLQPRDIILIGGKADVKEYLIARLPLTNYYIPFNESKFGLQERRGVEFYIHPKYSSITLDHDIAVIRVNKPFDLGHIVQTIPVSLEEMTLSMSCTILGWGLTLGNVNTNKLNFVNDRRVNTTTIGCSNKDFGPFICLQPSDSGICQGDSGSPLVCDGKVWGVASHYITFDDEYKDEPDCGSSTEEYYSELYPDLNWFLPIINEGHRTTGITFNCILISAVVAIFSAKT